MKSIYTNLIMVLLVLSSCTENKNDYERRKPVKPLAKNAKLSANQVIINKDTLVVNTNSAVVYQPDSVTIEKIKEKIGEDALSTLADDNSNYLSESVLQLEKMNIPVIYTEGKKIVKFVNKSGKPIIMRTDTISGMGNIYFYRGGKKPHQADITATEAEAKLYYQ